MDKKIIEELKEKARQFRIEIVKMVHAAGSGHPGGSLSEIDLLTALYFHTLKVDPKKRMTFNPEESIDLQGNTGPFSSLEF